MRLWHLYRIVDHDEKYFFIPINTTETNTVMYRSYNYGKFELVEAGLPSTDSDWPENEIVYGGLYAHFAIETLFEEGVNK